MSSILSEFMKEKYNIEGVNNIRKFTEEKKYANLFKEIAKQSKEMGMTKGNYLKNVLGVAQNTIDKWMLTEVIPRESMKKKVSGIMGLPIDYLFKVNDKFSVEA